MNTKCIGLHDDFREKNVWWPPIPLTYVLYAFINVNDFEQRLILLIQFRNFVCIIASSSIMHVSKQNIPFELTIMVLNLEIITEYN